MLIVKNRDGAIRGGFFDDLESTPGGVFARLERSLQPGCGSISGASAGPTMTAWSVEYEGAEFEKFLFSLPPYEQAVLIAAIEHVLQVHGIDICSGEWGKPLGGGLFEFRVRKSLHTVLKNAGVGAPDGSDIDRPVLIRVFCTFYGNRIVLLLHGYDKKRDASAKRQQREIARARKLHDRWKRRNHT